MTHLPADWSALCALVFVLGMRHGLDADHLATIDGLTRINTLRQRGFARWCGTLFSLGHGTVVIGIALGVGLASERWTVPGWVDSFGAWLSIAFLLLIALVNLRMVLATAADQPVAMVGVKGRLLGRLWRRLSQAGSPAGIAGVGALFALSFDTLSQSALFAVTATQFGGVSRALTLGLLFMLGMLLTDGLNGWWISRLIARADHMAAVASRVMSLAVSGMSLLVAALGIAKQLSPSVDQWSEGKELALGLSVVLVMAGSYLLARRLSPAPVPVQVTSPATPR
jgi:high-affinity nickel-transport protein